MCWISNVRGDVDQRRKSLLSPLGVLARPASSRDRLASRWHPFLITRSASERLVSSGRIVSATETISLLLKAAQCVKAVVDQVVQRLKAAEDPLYLDLSNIAVPDGAVLVSPPSEGVQTQRMRCDVRLVSPMLRGARGQGVPRQSVVISARPSKPMAVAPHKLKSVKCQEPRSERGLSL